jgi:hypothetical protein
MVSIHLPLLLDKTTRAPSQQQENSAKTKTYLLWPGAFIIPHLSVTTMVLGVSRTRIVALQLMVGLASSLLLLLMITQFIIARHNFVMTSMRNTYGSSRLRIKNVPSGFNTLNRASNTTKRSVSKLEICRPISVKRLK